MMNSEDSDEPVHLASLRRPSGKQLGYGTGCPVGLNPSLGSHGGVPLCKAIFLVLVCLPIGIMN